MEPTIIIIRSNENKSHIIYLIHISIKCDLYMNFTVDFITIHEY